MISFFKKFKYKTVQVQQIIVTWTDTGGESVASIIYKEDGFGRRKLEKAGDLSPMKHEGHSAWHSEALPWLHGLANIGRLSHQRKAQQS